MKLAKSYFAIFSLFFFCLIANAQVEKSMLFECPEEASIYDTDRFGNLYIAKENTLFKYNPNGELYAEYSNFQWGDIDAIDISNPLYILVFYRTFQRIEYLDNQLNTIRSATDINSIGLTDVSLICSDKQQNVWMYDQSLGQLFKYNIEEENIVNRSQIVPQLVNMNTNPIQLADDNYAVYLNIPGTGLVVFDQNAAYSKKLPFMACEYFQLENNTLYSLEKEHIIAYPLNEYNVDTLAIEIPNKAGLFLIRNQKIILKERDKLIQYKLD